MPDDDQMSNKEIRINSDVSPGETDMSINAHFDLET